MIESVLYKGISAVALSNEKFQAVILPENGCKLCSLKNIANGEEFVYQGKSDIYRVSSYGSSYLDGECAGVDQTFPTIDECFYDSAPWKGTLLPDHGEVWSLPWKYETDENSLSVSVIGVRLPYRLSMRIGWQVNNTLRFEYSLQNLSEYSMEYIWAAHMMLTGYKGCKFEFPPYLSKACTTMSDSGLIGRYGDIFNYPYVVQADGGIYDVSICRGTDANDYQKFYFLDAFKDETGWGRILYPTGSCVTVSFPTDEVPYLGAIQAEGGELGLRCMFLEPCSAAFDRPDIARLHKMNSTIAPLQTKKWYLEIKVEGKNG